jgi:hypothetical protein
MGLFNKLFGLDDGGRPEEASDQEVNADNVAVIGRYDERTRGRGHSKPMSRKEAAYWAEVQRKEGTGEKIIVMNGQRGRRR